MNQARQGLRSTQPASATVSIVLLSNRVDSNMDNAPQELANIRTHHVFMRIHVVTGCIFSDNTGCLLVTSNQGNAYVALFYIYDANAIWSVPIKNNTGRFLVTSNQGNAYIALFYIYNANAIWLVPIKNRSKEELLRAVTEVYALLTAWGYWPILHKMDNETSHDIEAFIALEEVKLQYCPPDMHCTNPAKRAVRTWKNHFTVGLARLPPSFPLAHWCRLTTQSNAMLNMMRPCHLNPLLSVHEALEGTFLFDATPMAPLGTEVHVYQKPSQRKSWGSHAAKAWYLSHAAAHYHCIGVIMKDTGGERVIDTFQYQHHAIPIPAIMATNRILEATRCLADAIKGVQEAPPDEMAAIQSLQALLLGKETPQEPEPSPQPHRPEEPLTVSPPAKTEHNNPPICMWNPRADVTPAIHKSCPPAKLPTSPAPAMIEDIIDKFDAPPIPVVVNRPARSHYVQPPQARPVTRSQLRECMTHMIKSAVSNALMPSLVTATATTPPAIGYAFAVHQLMLCPSLAQL
jgi:hypothetical protein